MHDEYFGWENINTFNPSFLFMLKLRLFGKRLEELHGVYTCVWYAYKGKLYMTRYDAL